MTACDAVRRFETLTVLASLPERESPERRPEPLPELAGRVP